jgi:hypothetical protein
MPAAGGGGYYFCFLNFRTTDAVALQNSGKSPLNHNLSPAPFPISNGCLHNYQPPDTVRNRTNYYSGNLTDSNQAALA